MFSSESSESSPNEMAEAEKSKQSAEEAENAAKTVTLPLKNHIWEISKYNEEHPEQMSANYVPPGQHRSLRACMVCSVVQTQSKFQSQGCPNCESFLSLAGNTEGIAECTSQVFEGLITLADPSKSWVARWQRIDGYVPGVYALKVVGIVMEDTIALIESAGLRYIPRDGSEMDDTQPEP